MHDGPMSSRMGAHPPTLSPSFAAAGVPAREHPQGARSRRRLGLGLPLLQHPREDGFCSGNFIRGIAAESQALSDSFVTLASEKGSPWQGWGRWPLRT